MSIKHKHYPHPVLESQFNENDLDFKDSLFNVSINYQLSENRSELYVEATFELENETLNNLIKEGKAVFGLLFICSSTSIRMLEHTTQLEAEFKINTEVLNQTVTIYPYILAQESISDYCNSDLIEPINSLVFEVKRGDILAIAADYEIYLEKEALFESKSIFEFVELKAKNADLLSFNPNHSKIQIFLPSETFDKVNVMSSYSGIAGTVSDVLISLFYVPAVVFALQSVTSFKRGVDGDTELLEYKDYSWYRSLEIKLIDLKLGEDLSDINEDKIIDLAHQLMENPNNKALLALDDLILRMEEDE